MGWLIGGACLIGFLYLIADKKTLREQSERLNRDWRVKVFSLGIVAAVAAVFLI